MEATLLPEPVRASGNGIEYRPLEPRDTDFIADAWLQCLRDTGPLLKNMSREKYRGWLLPFVAEILKRAQVRVAAQSEQSLFVLGFAVFEPGLLHMVYVRKGYRKLGIARQLLADFEITGAAYSTVSPDLQWWIREKWKLGDYEPFWLTETRDGATSKAS